METSPLKSFATSARTELIREVTARITAVLAQGSPDRVEQSKAVSALERAIAAAGGGDTGKAHVADKVAYTWFNRIIALRFMDANRYTGIGVVSPATDQVGQPEVLAAAKRGQIDEDVVKGPSAATVIGLLNGTRQPRRGSDAQAEAYALLLADYCRFWNTAMPFMFEREGDYTELLIPANLLADDSVLSRSVIVLTEDVCQDVEVIGWLYQFYISERKDEVFAGFKKNKRAGADEIPAATQLFTPHWIVRYLVENSLGRLWMLNRPSSALASQMDYYIAPADEATDFLKITKPDELKVIDPACGSGHMLTYAFDLLYAIYEEEGYTPSEIPGLILTNNLYGTEIDPRAGALAAFALTMKAVAKRKLFLKNPVEPNICVLDPISFSSDELNFLVTKGGDKHAEQVFWNQFSEADTLGSLIQPDASLVAPLRRHVQTLGGQDDLLLGDTLEGAARVIEQAEYLSQSYAVVVTNPPYMGSKNMDVRLTAFAKERYPGSKADLFAMFIERCLSMCATYGSTAMITMQSWMFISSYEGLRKEIVSDNPPSSMIHLGERAFDSIAGAVVSTTAFVLSRAGRGSKPATYVRVVDGDGEEVKSRNALEAIRTPTSPRRFLTSAADLIKVPGAPIAYWLSDMMRGAFGKGSPLGTVAQPREGLTSTDNSQFKRMWWEVSGSNTFVRAKSRGEAAASGAKWFPINNGGGYRKWFGNVDTVINWHADGTDLKRFIEEKFRVPYSKQIRSERWYFLPSVSLGKIGTTDPSFRIYPHGFVADSASKNLYLDGESDELLVAGVGNSTVATALLGAMAPTVNFTGQAIAALPYLAIPELVPVVRALMETARADWNDFETSWEFTRPSVLEHEGAFLSGKVDAWSESWRSVSLEQQRLESENNRIVASAYEVDAEVPVDVPLPRISLSRNIEFCYGGGKKPEQYAVLERADVVRDLISYAVGCMFGRYSLDERGLILANQGATLQDYLAKVPSPTFMPDADNVIPIVDGDWFEDDVVRLFRQFLRTAFGDQHFEENLKFVNESLGVRNLRDYFITRAGKSKFYDDHVQRYKKRPIYWLFSSPRGSFNALIYMHRYTPSTVSTVLTCLREYVTKLESSLQQAERAGNAKEADRLRKILVELNEYEHDTLYPQASENVGIDLDDGVKANYRKFGAALRKIMGLEGSDD